MGSKVEETVRLFVSESRKRGVSDKVIRNEMIKKGYMPHIIDKALLKSSRKRNIRKYAILSIGVIAIVLVLILGIVYLSSFFIKNCSTNECFIQYANNCDSVKMNEMLAGSEYELSSKDCMLTKTLKKMNESEPIEIKNLLEGKSFTCKYEKGTFDENLVKTISLGIENCQGELKDAIEEIVSVI